MAESPVRRTGGRSAQVRATVLNAGLAELVDVGFHALSLEGIAKRAGVNKTTLYRRWGDKGSVDARRRSRARVHQGPHSGHGHPARRSRRAGACGDRQPADP
ncbi:helix-turn-helix domain-containing protein [Kibdelosporangium aridum]|uniref:helix-turn-helix domain-containing protein n=1 Tax=Kibdelosporangium aridum TaxID=2030 RepID=UPI0035ECCCFB